LYVEWVFYVLFGGVNPEPISTIILSLVKGNGESKEGKTKGNLEAMNKHRLVVKAN
jgi:hypothetical protein